MCRRASFLAIRGGKVAWKLYSDSHDEIIQQEGLEDLELCKRNFIRIEVCPKVNPFSRDPNDWVVEEDEASDTFPSWYDREEWVPRILDELVYRRIPEEIQNGIYGGALDLSGTGITRLPEGLSVGGSLDLSGTGITSLPEGLSVGGWLDLRGTGVTSLPEGLSVGGRIYGRS